MPAVAEATLLIQTMFADSAGRTPEALQQRYADQYVLKEAVRKLGCQLLTSGKIRNKRVLLKPNWVKHNHYPDDTWCLRTHDSFVLAVLEYVLSLQPATVVLGDAPIQGCRWEEMISADFLEKIQQLSVQYAVPVQVKDFRRMVYDTAGNRVTVEKQPLSDYVLFDVGARSYLEPVTQSGKNPFRVSQYNPDRFHESHRPGMHRYCITRELFDAEVVISLPKIKTHQKSGITAALKNIVGLNGDKDFLPHHRIGGTQTGGDSYAGRNPLRYWSELALDQANRRKGKGGYVFWRRMASLLWKLSIPDTRFHQPNGAWYGNDTTWRMVMDLNLVIHYGKADGTLAGTPQRALYHFCDGIIAGQGDGPLHPEPLPLGVLLLSDSAALTDRYAALLMGMVPDRIPLLRAAADWITESHTRILLNGVQAGRQQLQELTLAARMPPGWADYAA